MGSKSRSKQVRRRRPDLLQHIVRERWGSRRRLAACLVDIEAFLKANRLRLSTTKTQVMWLGSPQQLAKVYVLIYCHNCDSTTIRLRLKINMFISSFHWNELMQSRGVRRPSVCPSVNFYTQVATSTTNMIGSPPNLHSMVPTRACIRGVLKVKVKVKGHVIWALLWCHEMFAIQYLLTFCLYMHSLYEAPLHSPSSISVRQLDVMSTSWNELLRHWRSGITCIFVSRVLSRTALWCFLGYSLQVTSPKGHWSDIYVECNDQVNIITW